MSSCPGIKKLKAGLYVFAFLCLAFSGMLVRMPPGRELIIFKQAINTRIAGMGCIALSVAFYLSARIIGLITRPKTRS